MIEEYAALSFIPVQPGTSYVHPPEPPEIVHLDSPALDVMTDFKIVHAITATAEMTIDDALEHMKTSGVRLLLVTGEAEQIVGLITAKDIQGERPIKFVEKARTPRSEISVEMIMTPQESITTFNIISVRNAQVGHIVETLNQLRRQHMLVVEVDEQIQDQVLRGIFSTSQISKQLGRDCTRDLGTAHSLAEMTQEIG